jgi:hypothetical protein
VACVERSAQELVRPEMFLYPCALVSIHHAVSR